MANTVNSGILRVGVPGTIINSGESIWHTTSKLSCSAGYFWEHDFSYTKSPLYGRGLFTGMLRLVSVLLLDIKGTVNYGYDTMKLKQPQP
jgi:hypothetical protein